jgi:hypothetical protein
VHEGYPLAPLPGGNVFLTNEDLSTPPDSEGNRLISCKPVSETTALRLAYDALRILSRLPPP